MIEAEDPFQPSNLEGDPLDKTVCYGAVTVWIVSEAGAPSAWPRHVTTWAPAAALPPKGRDRDQRSRRLWR